jgi:hypothetical protein
MTEQNTLSELFALQRYRKGIETFNSRLESMGIQHLKARTNQGSLSRSTLLCSLFSVPTSTDLNGELR